MNRKYSLLIIASVLSLFIVACSNTGSNNNDEPNNNVTTDKELPDKTPIEKENEEEDTNETIHPLLDVEDLSIITLVNKEYSLGEDHAPEDLVTVDVPTVLDNPEVKQLRQPAADALKAMFDKAEAEAIYLHARSGYRSYQTQVQLFQGYTDRNGEEAANRYSARAGQSEHQTGLVMDVTSESVNFQLEAAFGDTEEGRWIREHAHEFGFIIRYPEGKEAITGYIYEPWHLRYLGIDMATAVYESGLTYEEFLEAEGITDEAKPKTSN